MLEVRENETSLRKWSGGAVQLRTLEEHWFCSVLIFMPLYLQSISSLKFA